MALVDKYGGKSTRVGFIAVYVGNSPFVGRQQPFRRSATALSSVGNRPKKRA
ncbi:hypothetical protein ES703_33717 [subsurface metagenome]